MTLAKSIIPVILEEILTNYVQHDSSLSTSYINIKLNENDIISRSIINDDISLKKK